MSDYTLNPDEQVVARIVRHGNLWGFVVNDSDGGRFASGASDGPMGAMGMLEEFLWSEYMADRPCSWRAGYNGVNWTPCSLPQGHYGPHQFDGPESGTRPAFHALLDGEQA